MKSIQSDLAFSRQAAESTGELPGDRLVKAFRAKEFGRCPKCDTPALIGWRDFDKQTIKCQACGAIAILENYEIDKFYRNSGYYMSDAFALLVTDKMI